ncbi:bifunctional DNA-formamidopyrimidine glycosylase/DNA-(apurinic or apyrimidinic site) lyase [soil metagenome]
MRTGIVRLSSVQAVGECEVYESLELEVNESFTLASSEENAMPELPEVETVCRTLRGPLSSRVLTGVRVDWPRTIEPVAIPEFASRLNGQRVRTVFRRAKLIVCRLSDDSVLATHLRMTGKLLYVTQDAGSIDEPSRHLRVRIELDNSDRLEFYDARKFGRMSLLTGAEWTARDAMFGPEPLEPEFTADVFFERLRSTRRQIKPLLLDQTFIAGIGNIYADEALYRARIHPLQISSTISRKKAASLHSAIVDTLTAALENRGTTIRDYRSAPGVSGSNQSNLLVYGARPGSRCGRCGAELKRLTVGQRSSTICPRCQRLR